MEGEAVRLHSYIMNKTKKNVSWVHIDLKTKHWSKVFFKSDCHEQTSYEKMDCIVFVSQEAKAKFLELFGIDAEKCSVQYNLIDSVTIRELALSKEVKKEKLTVCMVGRLNGQKRYDRALAVAKRLKDDGIDFVLWIFGEGGLKTDIQRQIKEYALEKTVLLKGFVSPPYPYLAQADMFLSTSSSEGFSLVIAEAFCLGIPVVSTKTAGPVELIGDSEFGVLVDDDINSIYQGIKSILCNKKLREYYSEKSIERSTLFQVSETMEQIYSKL
jgi:glycosyltransferase involved in cell wall biosynthesis